MSRRQAPLTELERNALSHAVGRLRRSLEVELRRSLEGTYGIREAGELEDETRLSLSPEEVASRPMRVSWPEERSLI